MANSYDLLKEEFGGFVDSSTSSGWVICVFSFKDQVTASRSKIATESSRDRIGGDSGPSNSISLNDDNSNLVALREKLVIVDDCVSLSVQNGKDNHVGSMTATLLESGRQYLHRIFPGDWIMAWITNDAEALPDLVQRIKLGQKCNGFDDGLKFVGRVHSINQTLAQSPDGRRTVKINLQSTSFSELDSLVYYNEELAMKYASLGQYLGRLNKSINDFVNSRGEIDVNKAIPEWMKILLGEGVSAAFSNPGGVEVAVGSTQTDGAKFAYAVPMEVGALLGKTDTSTGAGVLTYADILELLMGVQRYDGGQGKDVFIPYGTPGGISTTGSSRTSCSGRSCLHRSHLRISRSGAFWKSS